MPAPSPVGFGRRTAARQNAAYAAPISPYAQRYDQTAQAGTYNPDENPAPGMSPLAPALSPNQIDQYARVNDRIQWRQRSANNFADSVRRNNGLSAAPSFAGSSPATPAPGNFSNSPMNDSSLHPQQFSMTAPGAFPNGPAAPRPTYDGKKWGEWLKMLKAQRDAHFTPGTNAAQTPEYTAAHQKYLDALAQQQSEFQTSQAPSPGLPHFAAPSAPAGNVASNPYVAAPGISSTPSPQAPTFTGRTPDQRTFEAGYAQRERERANREEGLPADHVRGKSDIPITAQQTQTMRANNPTMTEEQIVGNLTKNYGVQQGAAAGQTEPPRLSYGAQVPRPDQAYDAPFTPAPIRMTPGPGDTAGIYATPKGTVTVDQNGQAVGAPGFYVGGENYNPVQPGMMPQTRRVVPAGAVPGYTPLAKQKQPSQAVAQQPAKPATQPTQQAQGGNVTPEQYATLQPGQTFTWNGKQYTKQ